MDGHGGPAVEWGSELHREACPCFNCVEARAVRCAGLSGLSVLSVDVALSDVPQYACPRNECRSNPESGSHKPNVRNLHFTHVHFSGFAQPGC
jgi:hypothetical protein